MSGFIHNFFHRISNISNCFNWCLLLEHCTKSRAFISNELASKREDYRNIGIANLRLRLSVQIRYREKVSCERQSIKKRVWICLHYLRQTWSEGYHDSYTSFYTEISSFPFRQTMGTSNCSDKNVTGYDNSG